jgi:peptidoglycan/LPS O-acetylase OafA/YrhL
MHMSAAFWKNYSSTLLRSSTFLIGIIIGFFIDKFEKNQTKFFSKHIQNLFWLNFGFIIACPFVATLMSSMNFRFSEVISFDKPIVFFILELSWSLACSWIIILCHFGKWKSVNKFLSSEIWKPLEKLNLSIYLIHPIFLIRFIVEKNPPTAKFGPIEFVSSSPQSYLFYLVKTFFSYFR